MVSNKKLQHNRRTKLSSTNKRKSSICQVTSSTRSPSMTVQTKQYRCEEEEASARHNEGKETKSSLFSVDVVDGFAIFSFERYEDMTALTSNDYLTANLFSREDESPGIDSSITVSSSDIVPSTSSIQIKSEPSIDLTPSMSSATLPAATFNDTLSETLSSHQPTIPLANFVEKSTTVSSFTTVFGTSCNQIKTEPFLENTDVCMDQSISEHIGFNQNNDNPGQSVDFPLIENAMNDKWILKKYIKNKKKMYEERKNSLRLKQDYEISLREMEDKNVILTSQIQSLNTKIDEIVNENKNLKNKINIMNISLEQNKKLSTMELSQFSDKIKCSEELNDILKKYNLSLKEDLEKTKLSHKKELENMCKNYEDRFEALNKENIELKDQCKKYSIKLRKKQDQYVKCQSKVEDYKGEMMGLRYQHAQSEQNNISLQPSVIEIMNISNDEDLSAEEDET